MAKALIVLVYYERPNMIKHALHSIKNLITDNWELAFIDDGSCIPGEPIVRDILVDHIEKIKFYNSYDSHATKTLNKGSRHGKFMNQAILESDSDFVIIVCDDDALVNDSVEKLSNYYDSNPQICYSYSHIHDYNPLGGLPPKNCPKPSVSFFNRSTTPTNPSCFLDSSQVTFRMSCFKEKGIRYLYPTTEQLDSNIFDQVTKTCGKCYFNHITLQFKGIHTGQLGKATSDIDRLNPVDCEDFYV